MTTNEESPESGVEVVSGANAEVVRTMLKRNADDTLQALEKNPNWKNFIAGMVLDFIPVVGGVQKISEARKNFGEYPLNNNSAEAEAQRGRARERCLIGIVEVMLDTISGGTTAAIPDELLTVLNRINLLIKTQSKGRKLDGEWGKILGAVDVVGHIARVLLKIPYMIEGIDKVLSVGNSRLDTWKKQLPPPEK